MDNRELDKRIAEKVMNITAWLEKRGEYKHIVFQREGEREPYRGTQNWEEASKRYRIIPFSEIDHHNHVVQQLPSYSRDISSAFEVVEKLREKGIYLDIRTSADFYEVIDSKTGVGVALPSLPRAIGETALLSLEGRT